MVQLLTSLPTSMGLRFKKQNHSLLFDNAFMCSLDEGREDRVNLNCSENEQQWRRVDREGGGGACGSMVGIERIEGREECKGGGGVRWEGGRGGRGVRREGGRGGRGVRRVRREGAGRNKG